MPSAQHHRLDMLEVIGRIDDAGELIRACDAPARLARRQQSIVAHAGAFRDMGDSAQTWPVSTTVTAPRPKRAGRHVSMCT